MSTKDLPPAKRARTLGNTSGDAQGAQDAGEESPQVVNLVERRRLQNRISQQNYRNKIRVRLEKLEALVDPNAHGEAQAPQQAKAQISTTPKPQPPKLQNQSGTADNATHSDQSDLQPAQSGIPTYPSEAWKSIPDFLGLGEAGEENNEHSPEMHYLGTSLVSSHTEASSSAPALMDSFTSTSKCHSSSPPSFDMYQPEDFNSEPVVSEADPKLNPTADSDPKFLSAENSVCCACSHRLNFSPYGHYGYHGCAGTLPMSPLSPLGVQMRPFSPVVYPNVSAEEGLRNPTGNYYWPGQPSVGPLHGPCMSHQTYVWVPIPVPVLGAVHPEVAKPFHCQQTPSNEKKP